METSRKTLGAAPRELCELRRLTQQQVAGRLGVTVNYVSMLENGKRGISIGRLNELCKVLRVPSAFATFLATKPSGPADQRQIMAQI
jgi:transcriptional regulator with XRE-family HTH domain